MSNPLRQVITDALEPGEHLKDLSVLNDKSDPFRLDTDGGHEKGQWLADQIAATGVLLPMHQRGLYYALLGVTRHDGKPFVAGHQCWVYVQECARYARWLGYVPFEDIIDSRNEEGLLCEWSEPDPWPSLTAGIRDITGRELRLPTADACMPHLSAEDFRGAQPYHLVFVGEKASLTAVVQERARRYEADYWQLTGESSDRRIWDIAMAAVEDGRPMVMFYLSDCDPSGWQMPISISRKLQGFYADPSLLGGEQMPDFKVYRLALTPDQAKELEAGGVSLPSNELDPEKEKRAESWERAMGVRQIEIDALASRQPDILRQMIDDAVAPFWDATLEERVEDAKGDWLREALNIVNQELAKVQGDVKERLGQKLQEWQGEIDAFNRELDIDADDFDLPEMEIPEADVDEDSQPEPLLDSEDDWAEQTKGLIRSKSYEKPDDDEEDEGAE